MEQIRVCNSTNRLTFSDSGIKPVWRNSSVGIIASIFQIKTRFVGVVVESGARIHDVKGAGRAEHEGVVWSLFSDVQRSALNGM